MMNPAWSDGLLIRGRPQTSTDAVGASRMRRFLSTMVSRLERSCCKNLLTRLLTRAHSGVCHVAVAPIPFLICLAGGPHMLPALLANDPCGNAAALSLTLIFPINAGLRRGRPESAAQSCIGRMRHGAS